MAGSSQVNDMRKLFERISFEISVFNSECDEKQHTDTGDAWDLLNWISERCEMGLQGPPVPEPPPPPPPPTRAEVIKECRDQANAFLSSDGWKGAICSVTALAEAARRAAALLEMETTPTGRLKYEKPDISAPFAEVLQPYQKPVLNEIDAAAAERLILKNSKDDIADIDRGFWDAWRRIMSGEIPEDFVIDSVSIPDDPVDPLAFNEWAVAMSQEYPEDIKPEPIKGLTKRVCSVCGSDDIQRQYYVWCYENTGEFDIGGAMPSEMGYGDWFCIKCADEGRDPHPFCDEVNVETNDETA